MRIFLLVFFALFALVSHAQTSGNGTTNPGACTGRVWYPQGYEAYPDFQWSTIQAACDKYAASFNGYRSGSHVAYGVVTNYTAGSISGQCKVEYSAPAGASGEPSKSMVSTAASCTVNPCVAGTLSTANATVGWARSGEANKDDWVGSITFPTGTICDGQCQADVTDNGMKAWRSAVPAATGLHRLSVDFSVRHTGQTCTAASDPFNSAATPMACPGQVGEVNGKTVCVGTAASPVPSAAGLSPARQAGNPSESGGNPKAGPKPSSGEGSGDGALRTPAAGSGTAAGGPAAATQVTGLPATGTGKVPTVAGEEQAECGAPGQPRCAIDETGTPSGSQAGDQTGLKNAWDQLNGALDGIKSTNDKNTAWSMPQWFTAAACKPWDLGTLPTINVPILINICPIKPTLDAVLNFLWIVSTFFVCLGMLQSVMLGPSRSS